VAWLAQSGGIPQQWQRQQQMGMAPMQQTQGGPLSDFLPGGRFGGPMQQMGMAPMQGQQPMPGLQGLAGLLQGLMGRSAPPPFGSTQWPRPGEQIHEANPVVGHRSDGTPIRLMDRNEAGESGSQQVARIREELKASQPKMQLDPFPSTPGDPREDTALSGTGQTQPPPMYTTMPVPRQRVHGGPEDFARRDFARRERETQPSLDMQYRGIPEQSPIYLKNLRDRQFPDLMGGREDFALPGTGQTQPPPMQDRWIPEQSPGYLKGLMERNPVMAHREDGTPVRLGDRNEAGEPEWATMLGELTKYGTPQRADDTGMFPPPPPPPDTRQYYPEDPARPSAPPLTPSKQPPPPASTPPPPGQIGGPTPPQNKPAFEGGPDPQSSIPPRPPPWAPSVPEPSVNTFPVPPQEPTPPPVGPGQWFLNDQGELQPPVSAPYEDFEEDFQPGFEPWLMDRGFQQPRSPWGRGPSRYQPFPFLPPRQPRFPPMMPRGMGMPYGGGGPYGNLWGGGGGGFGGYGQQRMPPMFGGGVFGGGMGGGGYGGGFGGGYGQRRMPPMFGGGFGGFPGMGGGGYGGGFGGGYGMPQMPRFGGGYGGGFGGGFGGGMPNYGMQQLFGGGW